MGETQRPKAEKASGLEVEVKSKVVIPDWAGRVLALVRSPKETTRPNGLDLAGGSLEAEDEFDLVKLLTRETTKEELPGTTLNDIRLLYHKVSEKRDEDVTKVKLSIVLGAIATFPEQGIVLGSQPEFEHVDLYWPHIDELAKNKDMPSKYRRALIVGRPVLNELIELQQDRSGQPPVPLAPETLEALEVQDLLPDRYRLHN